MNKSQTIEKIIEAVNAVKETNPLAGSITNNITIEFVANAQLAVGGSAAMVYMAEEGEGLAGACNAMYINMGGLMPVHEEGIPRTAQALHSAGKAWVLDPVGLGIGSMRTRIVKTLKDYKPSIVRGNASEIIALAGLWNLEGDAADIERVRGVDTTDEVSEATAAAVAIAKWTGGAVAVSGKDDMVVSPSAIAYSHGGSKFMSMITGAGCSLGGVMAIYATVADPFIAALTATQVYNLSGSKADDAGGPASFRAQFIDGLYQASAEDIANNPFDIKEI